MPTHRSPQTPVRLRFFPFGGATAPRLQQGQADTPFKGATVLKLIPTDEQFFEMFSKQAEFFCKGTEVVQEVVQGKLSIKAGTERLAALESDADDLTHDIFVRLDRTFLTPFDRNDIHNLAVHLDDCMDLVEAAVDHLDLYAIETIPDSVKVMSGFLEKQSFEVRAMVGELSRLKWEKVHPHCIEINRLENEADQITRQALADLFQGDMDTLDVIKWRDILNLFEKATDKCEDLAGIIEGIALKNG